MEFSWLEIVYFPTQFPKLAVMFEQLFRNIRSQGAFRSLLSHLIASEMSTNQPELNQNPVRTNKKVVRGHKTHTAIWLRRDHSEL